MPSQFPGWNWQKCINILSDTSFPNTALYFTHLLVFGSPKGSPNTSKIRQNIRRYLAEKSLIIYNYLSKVNCILSDSERRAKPWIRYNQIIYDEPERDNCIIIYQNTKTLKKLFDGVTKWSSNHKNICNCLFQCKKTWIWPFDIVWS